MSGSSDSSVKPPAPLGGARQRLLQQLRTAGVSDPRVLQAIEQVPRHQFVDEAWSGRAYENTALPIGYSQTISQPLIVARMSEALIQDRQPQRVLEIGTGSGYQTAVLAALCAQVYSVERIGKLLEQTRLRLRAQGLRNVRLKLEDGNLGWPRYAPFDGIMITAACADVPPQLLAQLADGGRLIAPVGPPQRQELVLMERSSFGLKKTSLGPAVFVPLLEGVV